MTYVPWGTRIAIAVKAMDSAIAEAKNGACLSISFPLFSVATAAIRYADSPPTNMSICSRPMKACPIAAKRRALARNVVVR